MTAEHYVVLDRQASQDVVFGQCVDVTLENAQSYIDQGEAWACFDDERLVACVGINETFPGAVGVAWGVLARDVGAVHLAVTRYARMRIAISPLARIEAVARCHDAEALLDQYGALDAQQLIDVLMTLPTPECVWARLCGLKPAHVMRKFGFARQTYMLFERIA